MHDGPAHRGEDRLRLLEGYIAAADHEGQRRRFGTSDAARHRRIDHAQLVDPRCCCHRARGFDIDGRAVDQQRAIRCRSQHTARAEIDLAHFLARRQHGDHDLGARADDVDCACDLAGDRSQALGRRAVDIKAGHRMACLDQVLRHRVAHIAEPDEADLGHALPS